MGDTTEGPTLSADEKETVKRASAVRKMDAAAIVAMADKAARFDALAALAKSNPAAALKSLGIDRAMW